MAPRALPISIDGRVWYGIDVTIVAGAKISDDNVIGTTSLVKETLENPATMRENDLVIAGVD
jgi:acetyltransferase-like isoleucine patch superfamily enzyme